MENLWTVRAKLVENLRAEIFFTRHRPACKRPHRCGRRLRVALRLISCQHSVRSASVRSSFTDTYVTVHRFQENIGGRPYLIEVRPVSDKWRAQLLRAPGIPAAMMPFYGGTPDEAAKHLTEWLSLAHRRRMASVETPS